MDMYVFLVRLQEQQQVLLEVFYFTKSRKYFWAASISGAILCVLLYLAPVKKDVIEKTKTNNAVITKNDVFKILKLKDFGFALIIVGTAAIYDVFDQQFPNYYVTFLILKQME